MAPSSSTAAGRAVSRSGGRRFRFPCGHIEREATIADRVRHTHAAVWVGCRACNVIVLTAQDQRRARPGRRANIRGS